MNGPLKQLSPFEQKRQKWAQNSTADLVSLVEGEDGETAKQHDAKIHSTNLLFISAPLSFLYSPIISASTSKTLDSFHSEQRDTRRAAATSSAAQRAFDKIQFAASNQRPGADTPATSQAKLTPGPSITLCSLRFSCFLLLHQSHRPQNDSAVFLL